MFTLCHRGEFCVHLTTIKRLLISFRVAQHPIIPVTITMAPAAIRMYAEAE